MDADSIDTGADEAVLRIQTSLRKMEANAKATRAAQASHSALTGMLEELTASADEDTRNSDAYQYLAAQPNVTTVLSEAVHQMTAIAVNVSKVLKDKHGIQVDRPGYKLLKALAWHNESITEEAKGLNDPNWSAQGVWTIERVLRESEPWTNPSGVRDLIRVNTDEYSDDFAKAVNVIMKATGMDSEDAVQEVKEVFGALRGDDYLTEAEKAEQATDTKAAAAAKKVVKNYFSQANHVEKPKEDWVMKNRGGW